MKKPWLKISHHKHSGKLRPHEYTSYAPLFVLLVVVGIALTIFTINSTSDASPGPQAGSVGLTGTVPGKAPTTAATIDVPKDGQRFGTSPINISGTCPENTLVEIYKNDIFAGSATCSANGTYGFQIDLLVGSNKLVARVYDALNQPGPDSNVVTVYYDALPAQASALSLLSFGGSQLLLNTDAIYRGVFPNSELQVPLNILGGTPPYAVNVQWGDASNKVVPRNNNETFNILHVYKKAGIFQISFQATDAQGRAAFLTVAAIVNGQPDVAAAVSSTKATANKLLALWPLYTSTITIVISFWLGEKREKRLLVAHPMLLHS